ncbi:MAG: 30S ribosome-binding factor RbfA [Acidimicrobiia bacterium]|nr:30S ribosome-binding factor RbfA [Acidimicrobiia bacterium]
MSERMRRVNSVLREVIADEVEDLKDPRLGFVTITGVDTAPNLRRATVYYSVLGTPEVAASTQAALDAAAPRVSRVIGGQVRMKYTPTLSFVVDDAIVRASRIGEALRKIHDEEE